mmetsp:Transcript_42385/g.123113  ORF Transcript_42385/g.123113 Transcript_42385/m.123113 type:complete len:281 (-) Transcript_42385:684-1526(-)
MPTSRRSWTGGFLRSARRILPPPMPFVQSSAASPLSPTMRARRRRSPRGALRPVQAQCSSGNRCLRSRSSAGRPRCHSACNRRCSPTRSSDGFLGRGCMDLLPHLGSKDFSSRRRAPDGARRRAGSSRESARRPPSATTPPLSGSWMRGSSRNVKKTSRQPMHSGHSCGTRASSRTSPGPAALGMRQMQGYACPRPRRRRRQLSGRLRRRASGYQARRLRACASTRIPRRSWSFGCPPNETKTLLWRTACDRNCVRGASSLMQCDRRTMRCGRVRSSIGR